MRFVTEADQGMANAEVSLALAQHRMLPGDMFHLTDLGDEELAKSAIQGSVVVSLFSLFFHSYKERSCLSCPFPVAHKIF